MAPSTTIRFGSKTLNLDIADLCVGGSGRAAERSSTNLQTAVSSALLKPLNYPPLADALLTGDHIVVAVDWGVPELPAILAEVFETLIAAKVEPQHVSVLLADAADHDDALLSALPSEWQAVSVETHDPHDQDGLAYLAANKEGAPIYFNRSILDADFVLPVSVARSQSSLGDYGIFSGLFPAFTDATTACRLVSGEALLWDGRQQSRAAADEAGWLLGSRFTMQIVPAPGGGVSDVVAGDIDAVSKLVADTLHDLWCSKFDDTSQLVIACVGGGKHEQRWSNLARALDNAMRVADEDGAILLCCDIGGAFERALKLFHQDDDEFDRRYGVDDGDSGSDHEPSGEARYSADLMFATWLRISLQHHRIYLMSDLDENEISDLGLIHVKSEKEVFNLCQRHASCAVLADAQHAQPSLNAEVSSNC